MADTSLWPVVVGGLMTGLFALSGIEVGLVGAARRDAAQERRDARKMRADKFEELVAAVYEFDHWLDGIRQRDVIDHENVPDTVSPFAKLQSISAVYFPQFSGLIGELDIASGQYRIWIYNAGQLRLAKVVVSPLDGFNEAFLMCENAKRFSTHLRTSPMKSFNSATSGFDLRKAHNFRIGGSSLGSRDGLFPV